MELEERKQIIYQAIDHYDKVSHNQLWRILQLYFDTHNDSFSNKTFEKTLLILVKEGIIFKEKDKESKLGKTWYYLKWDMNSVEKELKDDFCKDILICEQILKKIEENFLIFDNYDRASDLVNFESSLSVLKSSIEKLLKIYPKTKNLKVGLKKIEKLKMQSEKLLNNIRLEDKDEVNQLIIRNQYRIAHELLSPIRSIVKA